MTVRPAPPASDEATRQHYAVEVELAARLRAASRDERLNGLYAATYSARLERIPSHPLLVQSRDPLARKRASRPQFRLLEPYLVPDAVFVEVGPGDCTVALAATDRVKTVYAVDVTHALVPDQVPENFHFVHSNGVDVPVPGGTAHLVYSNQVLEHLHPDDAYEHLLAIQRALAPGGRFICITPNRLSGPWDVSRQFDRTATGLHLKEYTLSEEIDLLRSVGFDVWLFASYQGRHLLRRVPESPVRLIERVLEHFPTKVRRGGTAGLVAVKVMATKPNDSLARRSQ